MLLLLPLLACGTDEPVEPGPACADGELLDGEICVAQACGVGTWGDLDAQVWVDAGAPEGGDGSRESPFRTVAEALAEDVHIGLAAGTYGESLSLDHDQDDVVIEGRCRALVTLDASGLDDLPVILADGRYSSNWTVASVRLTGGFPGVLLYDGGLTLQDVDVAENRVAGVLAGDSGARLKLYDVVVRDVLEESLGVSGTIGYGLDLESGATLEAIGLEVSSAHGVGLLALGQGTQISLEDVWVHDTRPDDSGAGYGVQFSQGAEATAAGLVLEANAGAGAIVGSQAIADLGDVRIIGTVDTGVDPVGLMVHTEGSAALVRAELRANAGAALAVLDEGSEVTVTDSELLGGEGLQTKGLQVQWGGAATLTGVTVSDHSSRGIEIAGGQLALADSTVSHVSEVAVLVGLEGTHVILEDVVIEETAPLADGTRGGGLEVIDAAVLEASGLTVRGAHGSGVFASSGATVSVVGLTLTDTHPEPDGVFGRGLSVQDGAHVVVSDGVISGNREAGVFVSSDSTAVLEDVVVEGTGRSGIYAAGAGLNVQDGGQLTGTGVQVTGTQGPGIYVDRGSVDCEDCGLTNNGFAGAVNRSGSLVLTGGSVVGNGPDDGLGGGVGVYTASPVGVATLVLHGVALSDHPYGSVYVDGPGSYQLQDADLEGGPGWELVAGRPLHGDAVFATGGVGPWSDDLGLLVAGCTLRDSAGAGVFLDGASASLVDNVWQDNETDWVQQGCSGELAAVEGGEEASSSECPETQQLVVPLEMQMQLEDAEASAF